MNFIFLCTELKRLYNVVICELLYDSVIDSELDKSDSTTDPVSSDDSSEDIYTEFTKRKNAVHSVVFMKRSLCFVIIDEADNCYGIYYPGTINGELNHCIDMSLFSLSKGIEVDVRKYTTVDAFGYIRFSMDSYLIELGSKNWLLRLYNDRIEFNKNQTVLNCYNRTIMRSSKLKQLLIFNCK